MNRLLEQQIKSESLHVFQFVSLEKDNENIEGFVSRSRFIIGYDGLFFKPTADAFQCFTEEGKQGETCRMYKSVNRRSEELVRQRIADELAISDDFDLYNLPEKAAECVMSHSCAAENRILLTYGKCLDEDITYLEFIESASREGKFSVSEAKCRYTPDRVEISTPYFEPEKLMRQFPFIEIENDGMMFCQIRKNK